MSNESTNTSSKRYYQVFDGKFRTKVPEGTEGALQRTNKLGKVVFEREVNALFGTIEGIEIEDSEYGKQIKITLDKNEDGENPVLSFGVESKNGRDVLKKLPAVDYSKEVRIMPYKFTPTDSNDEKSGISIAQQDNEGKFSVKVDNFFFDSKTKKYTNGFPEIDWDKSSESEKKIYKIKRDEFLLEYVEKNVLPRFSGENNELAKEFDYPTEDDSIDPSSIPF